MNQPLIESDGAAKNLSEMSVLSKRSTPLIKSTRCSITSLNEPGNLNLEK